MAVSKDQVDIAKNLSQLMDRMAISIERAEAATQKQFDTMEKLVGVMNTMDVGSTVTQLNSINASFKSMIDKMGELGKTQEQTLGELGKKAVEAGEGVSTLSGSLKSLIDSVKETNAQTIDGLTKSISGGFGAFRKIERSAISFVDYTAKNFPVATAAAIGFAMGLSQGLKNIIAVSKGVLGFITSLGDSVVNLAGAIISIPFKLFNGLIDIANNVGGGGNELAQAIENIRKEFGALDQVGPKTIKSMATEMKGFKDAGLSAFLIFGNMAKRLEDFLKLGQEMGVQFENFAQEFQDNGGALLAWQKGLGLSGEQMKTIADVASTFGTSMSENLINIQKQSMELGKQFGISHKTISRAVVKAEADVKHFSGATVKEISQAVVYSHKLGVELEKVTGILDSFNTFDQAAENASKLSQAFGITVDAFKLMESQDPAKSIEMIRKQMQGAGVDASKMDRAQIQLLASSTGLTEQTAKQVFSLKNVGKSFEEIKKASEGADKKQLSQADAMAKLSNSIERLVQSGGGEQGGGFFDRFFHGFLGGIQASKEFMSIIMNIKMSLRLVEMAGVRLGKTFVQLFPGISDIFSGLAELFSPAKFSKMFNGITDELAAFFKRMSSGNYSVKELMDNIKTKFLDFFSLSEGPGKKVVEGFRSTFKALSNIVSESIKWMSEQVRDVMVWVTKLIKGEVKLNVPSGQGGLGFLQEILSPLADGLSHAWTTLSPVIFDLLEVIGNKIWEGLEKRVWPFLTSKWGLALGAILFGPAVLQSVLSSLSAFLFKGVLAGAGSLFTKFIPTLQSKAQAAAKAGQAASSAGVNTDGLKDVEKVNKAVESTTASGKGWGVKDAVALGLKLVAIAGALAVGGVAMAGSIVAMNAILRAGGIKNAQDVAAPLAVLGGMVLATLPLILSLRLASKASGNLKEIAIGGAIITATLGIVGGVSALLAYAMSGINPASLDVAGKFMVAMSQVFLMMIPLVTGAALLGLVVASTGGAGIAAAAIGIGVISAAVVAIAATSMEIIKEVSKLKVEAGFQHKMDAFLGVMRGIQSFADTMVKLISMMEPTWTDFMNNVTFVDKIGKSRELLADMVGAKGKGGIIGVVETVIGTVKELAVFPGIAEASQVFSQILTAITSVVHAMTPPPEFYEAQTSFINVVDPTVGRSVMEQTKTYMTFMKDNMVGLTSTIGGVITTLSAIKLPDESKARVLSTIVSTTATLLKALMPDPESVKSFQSVSETGSTWYSAASKVSNLDVGKLTEFVTKYGENIKNLIPVMTSGVIAGLMSQIDKIGGDASKFEKLKVMGDILKNVSTLIASLSSVGKQDIKIDNVAAGATVKFTSQLPDVGVILANIADALPQVMESIQTVVTKVPFDKGFMQKVEVTKTLISFLNEIPKLATSLTEVSSKFGSGSVTIDAGPLTAAFNAITTFLTSMPINSIGKITEVMTILSSKGGKIELLNSVLTGDAIGGLQTASVNIKKYSDIMSQLAATLTEGGLKPGIMAVNDMLIASQKMDSLLTNFKPIDINAKLQPLAKSMGLGGKFNYEISSKECKIVVNLTVDVNAADMEKAMVLRESSIIRNRLNFATEQPTKETTTSLPAASQGYAYSPAQAK